MKNFLKNRWRTMVFLISLSTIGGAALIHQLGGAPETWGGYIAFSIGFFLAGAVAMVWYLLWVNQPTKKK